MIIIVFSFFYVFILLKYIVDFTFLISDYIWLKVNTCAEKLCQRHQKISF